MDGGPTIHIDMEGLIDHGAMLHLGTIHITMVVMEMEVVITATPITALLMAIITTITIATITRIRTVHTMVPEDLDLLPHLPKEERTRQELNRLEQILISKDRSLEIMIPSSRMVRERSRHVHVSTTERITVKEA